MNKKAIAICILSLLLVSCTNNEINSSSSSTSSSSNNGNTEKIEYQSTIYKQYVEQEFGGGKKLLPSIGSPKFLVVPVIFKDYQNDIKDEEIYNFTSNLNKAFFGNANDTSYESVNSYYKKASYGKLDIKGEVSDVFYTKETLKYYIDYSQKATSEGILAYASNSSDLILKDIYSYFFDSTNPIYNVEDYDLDKDGYIDSVYMIYYFPQSLDYNGEYPSYFDKTIQYSDKNKFLGSFVYWYRAELENETSLSSYCWSSYFYSTLPSYKNNVENYNKVDPHVYIHETGHLLGLDDYYGLTKDGKDINPVGKNTMMDQNILDLDSLSKYNLGWISPIFIDENSFLKEQEINIELKPLEENNQAIFITKKSNNTPFNEFLVLEYYTPTNLNQKDSENLYLFNNINGINEVGIKIYSVDQRLVQISLNPGNEQEDKFTYTDSLDFSSSTNRNYKQIAGNNDLSRSFSSDTLIRVISSISETRTESFKQGKNTYNSKDLFKENSNFSSSNPNYTFPSKYKAFFDIDVLTIDNNIANIRITTL